MQGLLLRAARWVAPVGQCWEAQPPVSWHNSRLRAHSSSYADTADCSPSDDTLSLDGILAVEVEMQLLPTIRVCLS